MKVKRAAAQLKEVLKEVKQLQTKTADLEVHTWDSEDDEQLEHEAVEAALTTLEALVVLKRAQFQEERLKRSQ